MITLRRSEERFHTQAGWLDSRHTFSFGEHQDRAHMGFRVLRVVNEDRVVPGAGFGSHPHRDMEIISYVLDGAIRHRDSMGNGSLILAGDVQRMTAGTGVVHSEHNDSATAPLHFLQIWILPERAGLLPSYEQRTFARDQKGLRLVVSPDGREGSVRIHQDVNFYRALLDEGQSLSLPLRRGRHLWVQVARGAISIGRESLRTGDGAGISDEKEVTLTAGPPSEALLIDLP